MSISADSDAITTALYLHLTIFVFSREGSAYHLEAAPSTGSVRSHANYILLTDTFKMKTVRARACETRNDVCTARYPVTVDEGLNNFGDVMKLSGVVGCRTQLSRNPFSITTLESERGPRTTINGISIFQNCPAPQRKHQATLLVSSSQFPLSGPHGNVPLMITLAI